MQRLNQEDAHPRHLHRRPHRLLIQVSLQVVGLHHQVVAHRPRVVHGLPPLLILSNEYWVIVEEIY